MASGSVLFCQFDASFQLPSLPVQMAFHDARDGNESEGTKEKAANARHREYLAVFVMWKVYHFPYRRTSRRGPWLIPARPVQKLVQVSLAFTPCKN